MENIEWLLSGNPVIHRLTRKYLLDEDMPYKNDGYIGDYLLLYDPKKHQWGKGFYSPKWASTHYTMMELVYMEIDGKHPIYQDAFKHLFDNLWSIYHQPKKQYLDMCIAGMLLQMACHGHIFNDRVYK